MKIVFIQWWDSFSIDAWQEGESATINGKDMCLCSTIGYLLSEDDKCVVICHTHNSMNQVTGCLTIPKGCIKGKIKYIR